MQNALAPSLRHALRLPQSRPAFGYLDTGGCAGYAHAAPSSPTLPLLLLLLFVPLAYTQPSHAQNTGTTTGASAEEVEELRQTVRDLTARVAALEKQVGPNSSKDNLEAEGAAGSRQPAAALAAATSALVAPRPSTGPPTAAGSSVSSSQASILPAALTGQAATPAAGPLSGVLPGGATLNFTFDGYYEYNFNQPIGRVNLLRAYDVLSNTVSINQADLIFERVPDVSAGRRFGMRIDLQFGQATETLQGNPSNEPRPEIYRNLFQAYGTYVAPIGHGVTLDFGKWASSLGIEGNYTKDQQNYSRSYFFDFLPFYHQGVRANYKVNDDLALNYWVVNGTNQSEPFNGYRDELVGWVATPRKNISWTVNYYLGQEHPDVVPSTNCGSTPVQPGLCFTPVIPAPNGRTHIFDSYATWQSTQKLSFSLEGDYEISRLWQNAAPGESSAPSHVIGGAGYVKYQLAARTFLAARSEYLSDRGGLYSGTTQALKEATATYAYDFGDGFQSMLEYRRDWSNVPFFYSDQVGIRKPAQTTLGVGLVWWYGGKEGSW